jgi:hypothetical protein
MWILNRTRLSHLFLVLIFILQSSFWQTAAAQEDKQYYKVSSTWLILQVLPSYTWTSFPQQSHFSFEWEATPILYSFGMNKLDPPWHFFQVTQPERFSGSIELNISTQLYPHKIGTNHWGFSGQLLAHLPLIEYGEYLGINLGAARYTIAGFSSTYFIGGFSTLFGFFHYNIKYSPEDRIWMNSIEFRFF